MIYIDKDYLMKEYIINKKTTKMIADEIGCNYSTITRKLKFYSIPVRYQKIGKIEINCKECNKKLFKWGNDCKRFVNNFCGRSCACTYRNKHRIKGYNRSKLEIWLEEKLLILYPTLDFKFNEKSAINSELDIYIPSLKLAFELNGIFHYEPIYGQDVLDYIKNNDSRKYQACIEQNIELCIIDTSKQKYRKDSSSQKYLDIIINIIDIKCNRLDSNQYLPN